LEKKENEKYLEKELKIEGIKYKDKKIFEKELKSRQEENKIFNNFLMDQEDQ
jgi:hypothetical protein